MNGPETVTLDGVTYQTSDFSQGVQNAVSIYNTINADLQKEQIAVLKSQSALQSIGAQIGDAIRKELEAKAEAASDGIEVSVTTTPEAK